jgi:hypothetical protein
MGVANRQVYKSTNQEIISVAVNFHIKVLFSYNLMAKCLG